MKERKSEKICKEVFDKYLHEQLSLVDIIWEKVEQKDEPPDYYITIHHKYKFAVEINESKVYRESILDDGKVLEKTFKNSCIKFSDEVQKIAEGEKILYGAYLIYFPNPLVSNAFNKLKMQILPLLMNYIKKTKDLEKEGEQKILIDRIRVCDIVKVHNNSNHVYPGIGGRTEFINSDVNTEKVFKLLQCAINEKKVKLQKEYINNPKILLFYDSYLLTNGEVYSDCIKMLSSLEYFHSIYVISAGDIFIIKAGDFNFTNNASSCKIC